ncbi:cellulose binding domain-containing protein [Micromonospora okii]|uniref:cellulose binding domain-containing protein n=1 Tax=Micromonospora okii TaxID=1182970 RepID=UPI00272E9659|nr:cellulose binding domain-containing protein [Micromonospora okii]
MGACRTVATIVTTALLGSLLTVAAARADDVPALTTPGTPVVVADEPHRLTLTWTPSAWVGEPGGTQPIVYDVLSPIGPHTYRLLGSTTVPTITLTTLAPGTDYRIALQAYTIGGYSAPSEATTVRTAYGKAKVSYLNVDWSPTDHQVQFAAAITNTGTGPLDLTTVRVRYHLLFEGGNVSLTTRCDWAELGCDRIRRELFFFVPPVPPPPPPPLPTRTASPSAVPTGTVPTATATPGTPTTAAPLPTPTPTRYPLPGTPAPGWVELTFTGGVLAPGASTGPIRLRFHRPDWSNIDERDDPSWRAATDAWADNSRITLDVGGVREFGDAGRG